MEEIFKVRDCVQLLHCGTPKMSITKISEENQTATCVRFDHKKNKIIIEDIPLNVLKKFPEPNALKKIFHFKAVSGSQGSGLCPDSYVNLNTDNQLL